MKPTDLFAFTAALALLALAPSARASGSATWNPSAPNGVWYANTNWTPAVVPNTLADTATFGVSTKTALTNAPGGTNTGLNAFVFTPGASAYSILFDYALRLGVIASGVTNDSGVLQAFLVPSSNEFRDDSGQNNIVSFINSAPLGTLTQWSVYGSGNGAYRPGELDLTATTTASSAIINVQPGGSDIGGEDGDGYGGVVGFSGSSTADHAVINVNGGAAGADYGSGTVVAFADNSTAANATITTTGGTIARGYGGTVAFYGDSTAAEAVIINRAGTIKHAHNGWTQFWDNASNGNATISAFGGRGDGGKISFFGDSVGTARIRLIGTGLLEIPYGNAVTIGSLEGGGSVSLGASSLTIGSNNLSTSFSGPIHDSIYHVHLGGSLTKIGTGNLVLNGTSTYLGGTTVAGGTLTVNSLAGTGTGRGAVKVNAGTLAGNGIIRGAVSIAPSGSDPATLSPGDGGIGTLTLENSLTIANGGTCACQFLAQSLPAAADQVIALGVVLAESSVLNFTGSARNPLPVGTSFTIINNTATTPIAGHFSNVADGAIIVTAAGSFQANYEGGDGNDLIFTVIP